MRNFILNFSILLICCFSLSKSYAQVGIGTVNPAPEAMLDIKSDDGDKGILIPHVNISDLNTLAPINTESASAGLMVFNTNETTGPGFYYWNGNDQWIAIGGGEIDSKDWYRANTTEAPSSIEDNIYTHGNVGIGIQDPAAPLHLEGTTEFIPVPSVTALLGQPSNITSVDYADGNQNCQVCEPTEFPPFVSCEPLPSPEWGLNQGGYAVITNQSEINGSTCYVSQEFSAGLFTPDTDNVTISFILYKSGNAQLSVILKQNDTEIELDSFEGPINEQIEIDPDDINPGMPYALAFRYIGGGEGFAVIREISVTQTALSVNADSLLRIKDGTQGPGKFLTSDAHGNAYWASFIDIVGRSSSFAKTPKLNDLEVQPNSDNTSSSPNLFPAVIEAIYEQRSTIKAQNEEINAMKTRIQTLESIVQQIAVENP